MDINQDKLTELYKHASVHGLPEDPKAIAEIVKHGRGNPVGIGRAYAQALKEKWPDEGFGGDPGDTPLPEEEDENGEPEPEAEDDGFGDADDGFGDDVTDDIPVEAPEPVKEAPKAAAPTPAPAKSAKAPEKVTTTVLSAASAITKAFIENPDGTNEPVDIVMQANGTIIVKRVDPKEEVKIMLAGNVYTVDLVALKKLPAGSVQLGLPVSRLIELATAAKG